MKQNKNTKRALTASIFSMILCCTMLIGSTFAWFTDSVTSSGNIIKSGTLDVTMEWADGAEALDTDNWSDASGAAIFGGDDLWEPGYTEVRHVRIGNNGNLALKYEIKITPTGEVGKLAEVIDVYYIKDGQQITERDQLNEGNRIGTLAEVLANPAVANGHILAGESDVATIALKMQETAGIEYMNQTIGGEFAIQLVATQYTEESDSFDDQYDKDAEYADYFADNTEELTTALQEAEDGDVIALNEDANYELSATIMINKDIVLDGNGATLTSTAGNVVEAYGNAVIKDVDFAAAGKCQAVNAHGDVLVENCTVTDSRINHLVYVNGDATNVVIRNCTSSRPLINVEGKSKDCRILIENNKFKGSFGVAAITFAGANLGNITIQNNTTTTTYSDFVRIYDGSQFVAPIAFEGNTVAGNDLFDFKSDEKDTLMASIDEAITDGFITGIVKNAEGDNYTQVNP